MTGQFSIHELDVEMSMDTYPHGVEITPLVRTKAHDTTLHIDSLHNNRLCGTIRGRVLEWNEKGECDVLLCKDGDDLRYSQYWKR